MPHFTKRIKTDFGVADFSFHRIFTPSGVLYHVTVHDERRIHFFSMEIDRGEWYVKNTAKTPAWISSLQSELSAAITEHKPFDS